MGQTQVPVRRYEETTQAPASRGVHAPTPPQLRAPDMFNRDRQMGSNELERGIHDVYHVVNQRDEENARSWASNAMSEARLTWTQHLAERTQAYDPSKDGSFVEPLIDDYDKYAEKVLENAPGHRAKAYLGERLNDLRATIGGQAAHFEAGAVVDMRMDQYGNAIQNSARLMNTDPSQYETVLAERLTELNGANIPPVKKSALVQSAIDKISTAAVWSQIQRNPTGFLQSIGFYGDTDKLGTGGAKLRKTAGDLQGATGNKAFDVLPFQSRVGLFESAIKAKNQIDVDADRAIAAQRKEMGDKAMKDGWDLWNQGKLTAGYITSIKPLVGEQDYHSLYTALKNGNASRTSSDPGTLRSIYRMIDTQNYDGARQFTYSAHQNGLLKSEGSDGLTGLLGHIDTLARQGGPKTPYERGTSFITQALDPGPMVHDPVGKQRFAEARDEFDRWFQSPDDKGKKRIWGEKEVRERAQEIVTQYKFISFNDTIMALPLPRGEKIDRQTHDPQMMLDQIGAAGMSLRLKRGGGKLTQAEYDQEMSKLNRWRNAAEAARNAGQR